MTEKIILTRFDVDCKIPPRFGSESSSISESKSASRSSSSESKSTFISNSSSFIVMTKIKVRSK